MAFGANDILGARLTEVYDVIPTVFGAVDRLCLDCVSAPPLPISPSSSATASSIESIPGIPFGSVYATSHALRRVAPGTYLGGGAYGMPALASVARLVSAASVVAPVAAAVPDCLPSPWHPAAQPATPKPASSRFLLLLLRWTRSKSIWTKRAILIF